MAGVPTCPIISSGSAPVLPHEIESAFENGADYTFDDQQWAAMVVLGPNTSQKTTDGKFCISILGAAKTEQEIEKYIEDIYKRGFNLFDIWKVKTNQFGLLPPPRDEAARKYIQPILKEFMSAEVDRTVKAQSKIAERRLTVGEDIPVPTGSSTSSSSSSSSTITTESTEPTVKL